jgi:hypothetical protein
MSLGQSPALPLKSFDAIDLGLFYHPNAIELLGLDLAMARQALRAVWVIS